ncbi:MAG: hypothetical protein WCT10_05090 [Patescibacteria group bacterium]
MKKTAKRFWKLGREEFNTQFFDITRKNTLLVREGNNQYNLLDLVKKYGSPLEVFFPFIVEARVRRLIDLFGAYIKIHGYKGKFFYHYPMKVNQNKSCVLTLISEGANLETSSVNELWIVKRLWEEERINGKTRVLCNGPKTEKYIALIDELDRKGVAITPIIESLQELEQMKRYRGEVGVRVDMQVKVRSHWDKKFNHFGLAETDLLRLGKIKNLGLLSYHISSQIETVDGLVAPIRRALMLYAKLREKNPKLDTIDIGGGGGVPYEKRQFYSGKTAINRIVKTFKTVCQRLQIKEPNIICEWGRYVAAPSQVSLFRVLGERSIHPSLAKKWYVIDGSFMNDLPDTLLVHQRWHVVPANNLASRRLQKVWLSGSSCDSDDKYTAGGAHVVLPKLEEDEEQYIAVLDTGAYQDALASQHCLLAGPSKLVAENGRVFVVRKRETPEDIGRRFGW